MKCIECGNEVTPITNVDIDGIKMVIGYQCNSCNLKWTSNEHIDDMSWAIHRIADLQRQCSELATQVDEQHAKIDALYEILKQKDI